METLFLDAPYDGSVELVPETVIYLQQRKYTKIALFASVQFCQQLEKVEAQLKEGGIKIVISQADRTNQPRQLLGCDNYHSSLNLNQEVDGYLYVGDGKFHPLALVYAQKDLIELKEVICNDPIGKKMSVLTVDDIKTFLGRYRASLMKFLAAKKIGVIVTIKPGQEQFQASLSLEKKYADKKFFYFIDNVISFDQLENFPFVEIWVNTACPRVGLDDHEKFLKGVINLNDALMAAELLSRPSALNKTHHRR